jgi:hypothetical protein
MFLCKSSSWALKLNFESYYDCLKNHSETWQPWNWCLYETNWVNVRVSCVYICGTYIHYSDLVKFFARVVRKEWNTGHSRPGPHTYRSIRRIENLTIFRTDSSQFKWLLEIRPKSIAISEVWRRLFCTTLNSKSRTLEQPFSFSSYVSLFRFFQHPWS